MSQLIQFDAIKSEVSIFVAPVDQIIVTDSQTNLVAMESLRGIKALQKKIEEKRKELVAPHNDFVKQINEYARSINAPLDGAESTLKAKMRGFAEIEEKARREAQAKIEMERKEAERKALEERQRVQAEADKKAKQLAAFGTKDPEAEKKAALEKARMDREDQERRKAIQDQARAIEAARPKNTRQVQKFEVTDINQVPREYLILDESKVRAAQSAKIPVPGIRYYEETIIVTR